MDENTPPDDLSPIPPQEDFMPPVTPPRTGCLAKLILLLAIAGVVVGGTAYFGADLLKERLKNGWGPAPTPVPTPTPIPIATPPPEALSLSLARKFVAANPIDRKMMVGQFAGMDDPEASAIKFLSESLPTAVPDLRADIVVALGQLAKKNPEAIPSLVAALDDRSLRQEAIPSLGALGPVASSALPKLKQIAVSKKVKKPIRMAARKAMAQIQGTTAPKAKRGKKHAKRKR